jgi:hypothetical protein
MKWTGSGHQPGIKAVPLWLAAGDALCDPKNELRRMTLNHLPEARSKLVEDVDARVAPDCRTEIVERP